MSTTYSDIIDAATAVHAELGPGHTESVYHRGLQYEFSKRGIESTSETTVPILYDGMSVGTLRPDMMVDTGNGYIIVELKAGSTRGEEQLHSYLDILEDDDNFSVTGGILIQFNDDVESEIA